MKDKRTAQRFNPDHFLAVIDCGSGEQIGFLTNIAEAGMLVHCRVPLDTNTGRVYALEIALPEGLDGHPTVAVSAQSVWFKREQGKELFVCGFRLVGMDTQGQRLWNSFLEKYKIRPPAPVNKRVSLWKADSGWIPDEHGFAQQDLNGFQGSARNEDATAQRSRGAGQATPGQLHQGDTQVPDASVPDASGDQPCGSDVAGVPFAEELHDDSHAYEDVKIRSEGRLAAA